ncbi:MAG: mismatch-specific DNA-glycosylase [Dehalococcoidia bacterium]|nr:mismatch-specific DNA-glycosylase [Dehalococcoidia bacterium]
MRPPLNDLPGLPDILLPNLKLVFVGYNPSLPAARAGHYYAGPQNHFYRLLHECGLVPALLSYHEDASLPRHGIGLTDLCPTPTAQAAHLPAGALQAGRERLTAKIERFRPAIVCFNGLGVYRAHFGHPPAGTGPQQPAIGISRVFVVPSTSPANNGLMREREQAFAALAALVQSLG